MGQDNSKASDTQRPASTTGEKIPTKMKALRLVKHVADYGAEVKELKEYFEVAEVDVPVPGEGEVLVKIASSPINPSDLGAMKGGYNSKQREELPCQLGFEGSGTVISYGGGIMGWWLLGKRVGVVSAKGGRMWSEYAVVPALQCVELPPTVTFEEGCSCFVNPLTALAFIEIAKAGGHRSMIHTAAASALGKMLIRLANRENIDVICVVRRQQQADEVKKEGAKHVIVTDQNNDWGQDLKQKCEELKCSLAFDAISGESVGTLLSALCTRGVVYVYGGLSEQAASGIKTSDLIFSGKKVDGFWLTPYLNAKSILGKKGMLDKVTALLPTDLKTHVRISYPLEQAAEAVSDYCRNMSAGKVCFAPFPKVEVKQEVVVVAAAAAVEEKKDEAQVQAEPQEKKKEEVEQQKEEEVQEQQQQKEEKEVPQEEEQQEQQQQQKEEAQE